MAGNPRVLGLLEEMLDAGKTPRRRAATTPSCSPRSGDGGKRSASSTLKWVS
jgi:hypothetical protein